MVVHQTKTYKWLMFEFFHGSIRMPGRLVRWKVFLIDQCREISEAGMFLKKAGLEINFCL